ncbi:MULTISPECIES: S-layer homology domain-containing protein [Bacillus cereus group]|uniref:S-layer homology domain-containing protein n=1 Tax=Bacillus cereus group TaxID=86661 RepID=UPI0022E22AA4|nr:MULTISPECIES: S-layer homology domain-containing protein [Bacillus cereus group]MDA2666910.1 S-layer homology domain-containing protein [Bacillus cereus group sp. Bc032]MDA2677614.1 S-layer homology domain-containing protein [Bacillus cereus group sp. Bc031]MDA2683106.1 S-layer homology domain-containing protein [Bacillus cereus group sp. Bc029]MDA2688550.1 S-layer homology domain-containing protein [Bacillus cereus group sp. Bc030]MDA2744079.1 S-layer homology domain-containing protein [Ba
MYTKLLKSITSLSLIGGALLYTNGSDVKAAEAGIFSDVPTSHWSYPAIKDLASKNILSGYGNGIFGFGDVATREQVAALVYRVMLPNRQGGTFSSNNALYVLKDGSKFNNPYGDINQNSTMFPEEILMLTNAGVFTGDEKGNFRPKAPVSRAEMAQILTNAFHLSAKQKHTFNDVPSGFWGENAISAVQSTGIASGTGEGKFEPSKTVTREQYAQFLYNTLKYKKPEVAVQNTGDAALLAAFKDEVQKRINAYETNITLPYKTTNSNTKEVMNTLFNAYKEVASKNEYTNNNRSNVSYGLSGSPGNYTFTLKITYRETKEQTEYVMKQAKAIVSSITQVGMDDHEKVKAIHDYVVKHVSYDTSYKAYTAYEALVNRSAVCQGYALLTYQLLKEAGIENHFVVGTGDGQPHAWNLVKIENKWYHLDTTFDDPVPDEQGRVTYSYFNLSDEQIARNHEWNRGDYPQATTNFYSTLTNKIAAGSTKTPAYQQILKDTKLNYLGNEYIANNYNELKNKMQQRYNEKSPKIEILYKQSMDGALQDVKKAIGEIGYPQGANRVSYKAEPYNAKEGYSLVTITFM